jgi:hypothetical protein
MTWEEAIILALLLVEYAFRAAFERLPDRGISWRVARSGMHE